MLLLFVRLLVRGARRTCHGRDRLRHGADDRRGEMRGRCPGLGCQRGRDRAGGNRVGDLVSKRLGMHGCSTRVSAPKGHRHCVARACQPVRGRVFDRDLLRRSTARCEQRAGARDCCEAETTHRDETNSGRFGFPARRSRPYARARVIRARARRCSAAESSRFAEAGPATVSVSSVRLRPTRTRSVRTRTVLPCALTLMMPRKRAA